MDFTCTNLLSLSLLLNRVGDSVCAESTGQLKGDAKLNPNTAASAAPQGAAAEGPYSGQCLGGCLGGHALNPGPQGTSSRMRPSIRLETAVFDWTGTKSQTGGGHLILI